MSVATLEDVAVSLQRDLLEVERKYGPQLLDRAEALILTRLPDAVTRAGEDAGFRTVLVTVEAESVARVLRSPNSGVYRAETEGDYTYQLNMQVASGLLDILPKEWERLGSNGAVSVVMPETDLYLQSRRHRLRPDLQFQCGWPGEGYPSSVWRGGLP